jgi:phage-related protein
VILLDWTAPQGAHKLVVPVGSASAVTAQAWLSLACDGVLGHYDIWFQNDKAGISDFHGGLAKDQRQWWTVPDGCTQITVHYSGATGPVGAAIETRPK